MFTAASLVKYFMFKKYQNSQATIIEKYESENNLTNSKFIHYTPSRSMNESSPKNISVQNEDITFDHERLDTYITTNNLYTKKK